MRYQPPAKQRAVALVVVEVAAEHRRPARGAAPARPRRRARRRSGSPSACARPALGVAPRDRGLDPGERRGPSSPGVIVAAARLAIMIPPVSVCHQLSWIGRPSASAPQRTASGFSGSPTLATKRSAREVALAAAAPSPARMSMRIAVGAVYQTVTRSRSRIAYQRSASNSASSTMHRHAVRERRDDAVGRAGDPAGVGRAPEDVVVVQVERHARRWRGGRRRRSWTCTAPFGAPVVPLVKCSSAGSSGSVGGIS